MFGEQIAGNQKINQEISNCHCYRQQTTGKPDNINFNIGIVAKKVVKEKPNPNPEKKMRQAGNDF